MLVLDPMLATGGSAAAALDSDQGGRRARRAADVHRRRARKAWPLLERSHPDVPIYTPVVDRDSNERKFIVPGLGDFGDRLYGTE